MIEVRNASAQLGRRVVLHDVSFAPAAGRLAVVVGPNGAGKSTLIKLLSGELAPVGGRVTLAGTSLGSLSASALAARRAVVPQAAVLAFPFTVREVVGLGSSVPGFGLAAEGESVLKALAIADIAHLHDQPYTQLSGGERQRVHFARALCQLMAAGTPAAETILLLDEPTSSLDLPHQMQLMRQARAEARAGRTVVAVLHDLNLAATWADDIVALQGGRVVACGQPIEVLSEATLSRIYGCPFVVSRMPGTDMPMVLPQMLVEATAR